MRFALVEGAAADGRLDGGGTSAAEDLAPTLDVLAEAETHSLPWALDQTPLV